MATDSAVHADAPAMSVADLVLYTKKELDADAEQQAKLQATPAGQLPKESQTGVTLDLSNKNITALPVEVIELIKDRVERLALAHNPSVALPSQIVQCERIRYLNIRWNNLAQFPAAVLQLSKLEILDISKNRIVSIPEDIKKMTSLKFLAVTRNRIKRLPLALGDMNNLQKLKFEENPIEFPPPEALAVSKDPTTSSSREANTDLCNTVKRFLKTASMRQRLRASSEEDSNESNVETPRPPKRSATGGRFPIRPSISGIENIQDPKIQSPSDYNAPPIPQRSHARMASNASSASTTPPSVKRPATGAPRVNGNGGMRSRSETVSSSASVRSRRQGFLPARKDLNSVVESTNESTDRHSQASTIRPSHTRAASSVSTTTSFLTANNGGISSGSISPIDSSTPGIAHLHGFSTLPGQRDRIEISDLIKVARRLLLILYQMRRPISEAIMLINDDFQIKSRLLGLSAEAHNQAEGINGLLRNLGPGFRDPRDPHTIKLFVRRCVGALRSYGMVAAELKRNSTRLVKWADAIYIRNLMLQTYSAMIETKNICTILGFEVVERSGRRDTLRASNWSSQTATPTQPKSPNDRRVRRQTGVPSTAAKANARAIPPPPVPLKANVSRSNTMTSVRSVSTPQSATSFPGLASEGPKSSRPETARHVTETGENEDQFDRIFLKLKAACAQAGSALPRCRNEFNGRRDIAQAAGQRNLGQSWAIAIQKCDTAIVHTRALKKRLESVRVNDPGIRLQRDFWQMCDAFVHSWTDLATEIKEIGGQRVDITTIKNVMRTVQKLVKDVSKAISHSPLYPHALGHKGQAPVDSAIASAFSPQYSTHPPPPLPSSASTAAGGQNAFLTSVPATPFSAALGPAAHATVANAHRDFSSSSSQDSRLQPERNDTVMQPPGRRRQRERDRERERDA